MSTIVTIVVESILGAAFLLLVGVAIWIMCMVWHTLKEATGYTAIN
jgi:hypothetical protein